MAEILFEKTGYLTSALDGYYVNYDKSYSKQSIDVSITGDFIFYYVPKIIKYGTIGKIYRLVDIYTTVDGVETKRFTIEYYFPDQWSNAILCIYDNTLYQTYEKISNIITRKDGIISFETYYGDKEIECTDPITKIVIYGDETGYHYTRDVLLIDGEACPVDADTLSPSKNIYVTEDGGIYGNLKE